MWDEQIQRNCGAGSQIVAYSKEEGSRGSRILMALLRKPVVKGWRKSGDNWRRWGSRRFTFFLFISQKPKLDFQIVI